jgi:thiol:disulfide interchange protein
MRPLFLAFLFLSAIHLQAQVLAPAKWTVEASRKTAKAGDEIELIFRAKIDDNWYAYANDFDADCGPLLTEIQFDNIKNFEVVGKTVAIDAKIKHDKIFGCDVKIFLKTGELRQKIKVLGSPLSISGVIQGQVCTEIDGKCIPFDHEFTVADITVTGSEKKTEIPGKTEPEKKEIKKNESSEQAKVEEKTSETEGKETAAFYGPSKGPVLDKSILEGEPEQQSDSLVGYMILAFVLGLTSLVTPCVFPMIPMTVTFFLRDDQSKKEGIRKALIFGISIIVIYTIAGTIFALAFGAEGLNALATHWAPNLLIFVMFIVFALSFLGLFEINAPHKLVNKADQAAEKGGVLGIFFMSATLVLVSFSCTIPIVSNVLVLSAGGQILKPVLGMLGYSAAFAIPFTLFAFFPEWLKRIPKSGGWLNTVKVTLGLIELALALKFLSIADQTYHWGILDREINIGIWVVIFTILGFYFLGKVRMSSDAVVEKVSVSRLMLAIATFSFVVYLVPGLWGAPLKALAGYLPPMYTHDFDLISLNRNSKGNTICDEPKYGEFLHLPHGLNGYFDYDQALACARQQNKPLFIDFTGHGCTNCREMEANVWADPEILQRLKNDFVIVALYVDDKTQLPESEWYTSKYDKKQKKTIGKKNADLQITNLDNNAQPFYVLVGKDEKVLAWPKAYDRSVENFKNFLESGKKTYNRLYPN